MTKPNANLPEPGRPETSSLPVPAAGRALRETGGRALVPAPPGLSQAPDLPGLLKALRRRWLLAMSIGLVLSASAAAAVWCLLSPNYTAFAQLYVAANSPYVVYQNRDEGRGEFLTYMRTQAARVRSRFVLSAALKREEVRLLDVIQQQPEPLLYLEENLQVQFAEGSEIMTVTMTGLEPAPLIAIVNAVTQAYLKEVVDAERTRRTGRMAELEDIYIKSGEKLRLKRETLKKLAEDLGTGDSQALSQKQVNILSLYNESRRQHQQVLFELMRMEGRMKAHQARASEIEEMPIPDSMVNEVMEQDPRIKQYTLRMAQIRDIVEEYRANAVDAKEPTRVRAEKQLETLQQDMEKRMVELRGDVLKRMREKNKGDFQLFLAQFQNEVALLQEQEKPLRDQVEGLAKKAEKLGSSTTELEMLRDDIQREGKTVDRVGEELDQLKVELRRPSRVSLYQEAGLQRKDIKKMVMALVGAPIAVFALVCLLVAFFEFRVRRIQTSDEVTKLGMRVVGGVPPLAQRRKDEHSFAESIDGIRTMLLRNASVDASRVVMVTSAVHGEGKTTLATHLASSLARAGRKTLLIDCDLRRPALHQLFEVPLQPGFSEVLLREVHMAEATRATPIENLWMIPAGQWDGEVMQALTKDGGVEEIFDKLKGEYDFVVLDSHPVLAATDSLVIGQHADGVLLSLLKDVSQAPRIYAAGQRLGSLGIRVLGSVVHGLPQEELVGGFAAPARLAV